MKIGDLVYAAWFEEEGYYLIIDTIETGLIDYQLGMITSISYKQKFSGTEKYYDVLILKDNHVGQFHKSQLMELKDK